MADEVAIWNKVMSSALAIPGVKVDRESFLRSAFRQYCTKDELEKAIKNPVDVLPQKLIDNLADSCINNHLIKVSSISFFAGIPGGLTMAATIPADMANYFWHALVLAQKLAYLYGIQNLCDENGIMTETTQEMLTLLLGVMMGVSTANEVITNASRAIAVQTVKRLPQKALTKTFWYPFIKSIAKALGIKLTKQSFAKAVGKIIPVVGGVFSMGLTAATFRPAAKRLQKKLREQMHDLHIDSDDSMIVEDQEVEDVTGEEVPYKEPTFSPAETIILFLISLAKMNGGISDEQEKYLSVAIESSELSDDEQLELAQEMEGKNQLKIDFTILKDDMVNSAILLQKGSEILKLETKMSLAQKLYFKKIVKELGFSMDDIGEAFK